MNHHALLLVGEGVSVINRVKALTEDSSLEILTLPFATLTISDVRFIIKTAHQTPAPTFRERVIVIHTQKIAIEAAEALLKILEEPPLTTTFIFSLPSIAQLPDTLLSRFTVEFLVANTDTSSLFNDFFETGVAKRLLMIADIVKRKADTDFLQLETGLVNYLNRYSSSLSLSALTSLSDCLQYLRLRGASKKMIWEEIALTLPVALSNKNAIIKQ